MGALDEELPLASHRSERVQEPMQCATYSSLWTDQTLQFASKEISRAMVLLTVNEDDTLKGLAHYHLTVPRLVWCCLRQPMRSKIVGLSDADCAACPVTRKYSGCTCFMLGRHPILAGTATQSHCRSVKKNCTQLCVWSMADLGVSMQAELRTDCSAARGFTLRRGARQVRHIHCPALWQQPATATRKIREPGGRGALKAEAGYLVRCCDNC